jgi:hypothetical protein
MFKQMQSTLGCRETNADVSTGRTIGRVKLRFVLYINHGVSAFFFARFIRTPGRSSGVPVNSIPAASKAFRIFSRVCELLLGTESCASIRLTVLDAISARPAKSSVVQRSALLAALIWIPVIIDHQVYVTYSDRHVTM